MKTISIILALLLPVLIFAQNEKKYTVSVSMGINHQFLDLKASPNSPFSSINSQNKQGFELSILNRVLLKKNWYLELTPQFAFQEGRINYYPVLEKETPLSVKTVEACLPIHLTYEWNSLKLQPHFIIGGYASYFIKEHKEGNMLETNHSDLGLDFGIGIPIKVKGHTMRIESIYSLGLYNINSTESISPYNTAIEKLNRSKLALRFTFLK